MILSANPIMLSPLSYSTNLTQSTTSLRKYYASFKSFRGILASLLGGFPLISSFLPGYLHTFPPLGDIEAAARGGLVILAFGISFCVYFWSEEMRRRAGLVLALAIGIILLSLFGYLALSLRFVTRVDIPSRDSAVYVSIGYERTPFANSTFGPLSDTEMLRERGTDEEQVRMLWTSKSLIIVRLLLYATYSLLILSLVGVFSFAVVHDMHERAIPAQRAPRQGN